MRDPADAALGRGGEQRRRRRARIRRAVMPEDGEPGGAITGAGVVNVQYAPVIQRKVGLCHHVPSLMTSAILSAPHPRLAAAGFRGGAAGVKRNWASQ
jgi:hypothetical protein